MCGRYLSPDSAAIEREFNLVHSAWRFPSNYNVSPTQDVAAIRHCDGATRGIRLRWGLVPYFAHGVPTRYSTINARMETVRSAASFRRPWQRGQRCLLPATGFYEWQLQADGQHKVPYYIHLTDQELFAFAGLWESSHGDAGVVIESCTHLTMPANTLVATIHNTKQRMPAILRREDREAWLRGTPEEAWAVLLPYPAERMEAWPISTRVNSPAHNDAGLITPVRTG